MNTLTTPPVAPLIARLYQESDAAANREQVSMSDAELSHLMKSKKDYRDFYGRLKNLWLPVSRETGTLLYMLARSSHAETIVEYGTSFGISTLHLAAALRDNGGGKLITTEFEPSKVARARKNIEEGGLSDLVEFREGDAIETLRSDLPGKIDFLLLDGAKSLYADILDLLESRLKPGALIVADNSDYCPEYVERIRSEKKGYISISFADDVEVSMKLL